MGAVNEEVSAQGSPTLSNRLAQSVDLKIKQKERRKWDSFFYTHLTLERCLFLFKITKPSFLEFISLCFFTTHNVCRPHLQKPPAR